MNRQARVLHLNTARTWRGGERQVWFLARALARRGIFQWVVGRPGSELERRCREANLPFHAIAMRGEWDLLAVRQLRAFAREQNINILHAHTSRAHGLGLMAVRRLPGTRFVVSRRVDFPAGKNWFSRRKYLSPLIAAYVAISENVRQVLIADGVAPERIHIAYSGIDLSRFAPLSGEALRESESNQAALRREFELDTAPPPIVLGNVAALVDHKDQRTLLHALARLREISQIPFRCLIFGEGELRGELEKLAADLQLGPEHLRFAGFRDGIDDAYRIFDIFVMSSKEEGLGTAVLDAMAYGLPVAATRGGGIPEMIVDEEGGLLAPVGDAPALAKALARLLESETLRQQMGAYNQERVKQFGTEATCQATLAVYERVLADSGEHAS